MTHLFGEVGGNVSEYGDQPHKPLRVYGETGRMLGAETLKPGDDVVAAARKLLRDNHGRHGAFNDPINLPNHGVV